MNSTIRALYEEYKPLNGKNVVVRQNHKGHNHGPYSKPFKVTGVFEHFITIKNPEYGYTETVNFVDIITNQAAVTEA